MKFDKSSSSDNKGIATILNKFFTSVADRLKPQSNSVQEQGIYSGNSTIKLTLPWMTLVLLKLVRILSKRSYLH